MKKVLLRAPVLSKSGYGEHSRQVLRYLLQKPNVEVSIQTLPWGATPWTVNSDDEGGLIGEVLKRSTDFDKKEYDVSIQIQLPNEWDPTYAKYNVGVTAGVETDKADPQWTSLHCQKMDKVIVPSEHTKKTLVNSAKTTTDIEVVPECYYDCLTSNNFDIDLNLETEFNFLTVGVLTGNNPYTDRKNLFFLIKWFVEEFSNNPNVGLIIKTSGGRDTTIDKHQTRNLMKKLLNELGHDKFPRVYLLHGPMSREDMTALYKHKTVKAFISCTRGEGFGLPFLEAAVAGLPVIATNWSAHKEFLDRGNWIKVESSLQEVHKSKVDNQIFIKGAKWAECSEQDFKKKLSTFYKKPHTPKKWAKELSDDLIKSYSFEAISERYDEVLGDLLL